MRVHYEARAHLALLQHRSKTADYSWICHGQRREVRLDYTRDTIWVMIILEELGLEGCSDVRV